jgi:LmbE family N-acetylglucosaminyl deacetylase
MNEQLELRLLAVFAHPDDESFGVGGTLARYAAEGASVHLVCATHGEAGSTGDPPLCAQEELGAVRERELRAACAALGVRSPRFLGCVDGRLETCPQPTVVGEVTRALRELRPQVVITFGPDGISGHPDHVAISQVTAEALAAAADPEAFPEQAAEGLMPWEVRKLYHLVSSRSTSVACDGIGTEADEAAATARIDTLAYLDAKLKAMRSHRSQCQAFDGMPEAELRERLRYEYFRLAVPSPKAGAEREGDLFQGAAPALAAQA